MTGPSRLIRGHEVVVVYVFVAFVAAFFTVALFPGDWGPAFLLAPFVASTAIVIVAGFLGTCPVDRSRDDAHKRIVDKRALGGTIGR
jgi:hypothetical protein